jgi:hypothetical protein
MKLRYVLTAAIAAFASIYALSDDEEVLYYPEILTYRTEADLNYLKNLGVIIYHYRDNMALTSVPRSLYSSSGAPSKKIKELKDFHRYLIPKRGVPTMDIARTMYDADKIGTGEGLSAPYTGQGVVVGFCDIGFDPTHINFLDADGNTRVKQAVYYNATHGIRQELNTPEEIAEYGTDYSEGYHATHVAGIMAGSCEGSPYTGMAPNADIVATTSLLSDVGVLAGAEDIIKYAKSVGKPCSINISIGNYTGPHDGSTLFNQYLASLGKEALISISAGNGGQSNGTLRCEFTDSKSEYRTRLHNMAWNQFDMYGEADSWSDDDKPFKVRILILDEQEYSSGTHDGSEIVYELPIADCSSGTEVYVSSETDSEFAKYFTGIVYLYGGVDSQNGRRYITTQYNASTEAVSSRGKWARYVMVLQVEGDPGTNVDVYCDNSYTRFTGFYGEPSPTSNRSVSDMATGDNVICVGMYNTRATLPQLGGEDVENDHTPGYVNSYSGYGTLIDGRVLPITVAPGGGIISSYSGAYVEKYPEIIPYLCYKLEKDGTTYYWGNEVGTSMSTPYVAGCLATWLEANPDLTIDDVKKIIKDTNLTEYTYNPTDPRHGQGWFQPYEGIKAAISLKGVGSGTILTDSGTDVRLSYEKGTLTVWNPSGAPSRVDIYNTAGIRVISVPVNDTISEISLSGLPDGVYIVRNSAGRCLKINF